MTVHAGFLADIIEHPDDDTPRLIYADWLEEHGDAARANFIRAQCHLARFCRDSNEPFESGLPAEQLREEHRHAFLAPLLEIGLPEGITRYHYGEESGFTFRFRRGFVEDIEVYGAEGARQFAERAEAVFTRTPLLHLRFQVSVPQLRRDLRHATHGGVYTAIPFAVLKALLDLPAVRHLRLFDLREQILASDAVQLVLDSPHLHPSIRLLLAVCHTAEQRALKQRFGEAVTFHSEEIPF